MDYSSTVIHECEIKVCCQICDTEEETWHDWAALPDTVQSNVWLFAQVCIIMTSGGAPHKYVGYHVKMMLGGSVFSVKYSKFLVCSIVPQQSAVYVALKVVHGERSVSVWQQQSLQCQAEALSTSTLCTCKMIKEKYTYIKVSVIATCTGSIASLTSQTDASIPQ